ncbi:MAG: C40 family peptidase [Treponema sp.]|jgi:hypothetical protein|nr:C40 family peptidase [Treponema sp.]
MRKRSILIVLVILLSANTLYADNVLRQTIIETAKQYQGVSYRYGAESPKGFDCSGFVRYVYRTAVGIELPRSSRNIWNSGESIPITEAKPGDIVVFAARKGGIVDHVAILLDNNSIIHAVSQGPKTGVIISPLTDRYFGPRILGVKTFIIAQEIPMEVSIEILADPTPAEDSIEVSPPISSEVLVELPAKVSMEVSAEVTEIRKEAPIEI